MLPDIRLIDLHPFRHTERLEEVPGVREVPEVVFDISGMSRECETVHELAACARTTEGFGIERDNGEVPGSGCHHVIQREGEGKVGDVAPFPCICLGIRVQRGVCAGERDEWVRERVDFLGQEVREVVGGVWEVIVEDDRGDARERGIGIVNVRELWGGVDIGGHGGVMVARREGGVEKRGGRGGGCVGVRIGVVDGAFEWAFDGLLRDAGVWWYS